MPSSQQVEITIGPYEIVGRPSVGDALTYIARKPSAQGRGKLYLLHVVQLGEGVERDLEHEVQLSAGIMHPAKPHVVDFFQWEKSYVLAFEHVDGVRLSRLKTLLERGSERLHDEAVWYLGLQVMGALARAHVATDAFGTPAPVVHARLSPQRILVSWEGRVMLVGLGLPTILEIEARADADDEEAAAYLAPELREGRRATPGADAYAAAVVLWSLLTGRKPPLDVERLPSLGQLRPDVPEAIRKALDLALEPSLGARKIRCVDIERELRKVANVPSGKAELRDRLETLRALLGLWSMAPPKHVSAEPTSLPPPSALLAGGPKPIWRDAKARWGDAVAQGDAALPEELGPAVVQPKAPATGQAASARGAAVEEPDEGTAGALLAARGVPTRMQPARAERPALQIGGAVGDRPSAPRPGASRFPGEAKAAKDRPGADSRADATEKSKAEAAKLKAETTKPKAEAAKPRADTTKPRAEAAKPKADTTKPSAEAVKPKAETIKSRIDSRIEPDPSKLAPKVAGAKPEAEAPGPRALTPKPSADPRAAPDEAKTTTEARPPKLGADGTALRTTTPAEGAQRAVPDPAAVSAPEPGAGPGPTAQPKPAGDTPQPSAAGAAPVPAKAGRAPVSGKRAIALLAMLGVTALGGWLGLRVLFPEAIGPRESPVATAKNPPGTSSARPKTSASPRPSAAPSPSPTVDAGAPAAADAGQGDAAVAAASSGPSSGTIAPPPGDGSDLLSYEGYLLVRSSASAEVFVHGKDLGPTNTWLRSRCTQRFIRIAAMPGSKWLSSGLGVRIACRGLTEVTIEPEPGLAP